MNFGAYKVVDQKVFEFVTFNTWTIAEFIREAFGELTKRVMATEHSVSSSQLPRSQALLLS